jgi:hypothetical protein
VRSNRRMPPIASLTYSGGAATDLKGEGLSFLRSWIRGENLIGAARLRDKSGPGSAIRVGGVHVGGRPRSCRWAWQTTAGSVTAIGGYVLWLAY